MSYQCNVSSADMHDNISWSEKLVHYVKWIHQRCLHLKLHIPSLSKTFLYIWFIFSFRLCTASYYATYISYMPQGLGPEHLGPCGCSLILEVPTLSVTLPFQTTHHHLHRYHDNWVNPSFIHSLYIQVLCGWSHISWPGDLVWYPHISPDFEMHIWIPSIHISLVGDMSR